MSKVFFINILVLYGSFISMLGLSMDPGIIVEMRAEHFFFFKFRCFTLGIVASYGHIYVQHKD